LEFKEIGLDMVMKKGESDTRRKELQKKKKTGKTQGIQITFGIAISNLVP
jgi:hypothetical protein